jgi:uncharacterized protein (TIGR03437 family)
MSCKICVGVLVVTVFAAAQYVDKPRARSDYFNDQRRFPRDRYPVGERLKAMQALEAMPGKLARRSAVASAAWQFIGPQPIDYGGGYLNSGRVMALAVDPRSNDTVYAGAAEGGVWKTTDGGTTWTPLTDNQPSLAIGSIVLDPNNPDAVFAGTGEGDGAIDSYSGAGILKSLDAGATWRNIVGPFAQTSITGLAVNPKNSSIMLAASSIGVYRSGDGGETWTISNPGVAISVFFDPAELNVAWASVGNERGSTANGVYRSSDAGLSWTLVSGTGSNQIPTGTATGRIQIVNIPTSPDSVLALVANPIKGPGASLNGVYKTTDAGSNWTQLSAVPDFCNPQCWYDMVLQPHPLNPAFFLGGGNVINVRSTDGGATWQVQGVTRLGVPHADNHALVFTNDGTRLYLGNDGGVWSTDVFAGNTIVWNDLNATLAITQYYPSISIHPSNPQIALAGSQDNGTQMYGGQLTWPLIAGGDGGRTAIDPSSPNIAYISVTGVSLYRTQHLTNPTDFLSVVHGIDPADRSRFIGAYVMDPIVPQRMYYGTDRLYQSLDGGGLWLPISPDLTGASQTTTSETFTISSISISPADPKTIFTGSYSASVFQTTDGGNSWTDRSAGLPFRSVTHITPDLIDPGIVYVTFSGLAGAGDQTPGHVYKSSAGGNSWTDISGNLPNLPVDDLVIDPDLPNTLYAATDAGVMFTADGGTTWNLLGIGMPKVAVLSLMLHRPTRTLRAATHGRGMWDYPLGSVTSAQPVITSLSPATANAGDGAFTLTIAGTNLGSGLRAWWNGQDRPVTGATSTSMTVQIPTSDIQNVGRASIVVFNPAVGASAPASLVIGPTPVIGNGGLVSSANPLGGSKGSPGALLSVYGASLAGSSINAPDYPVPFPLPATLGGVTVTIGGNAAPLYYVSPGLINFQVPYSTSSRATQTVFVSQGTLVSAAMQLPMAAVTPALFTTNGSGSGQGSIRIADATAAIAAPVGMFPGSRPAKAGDYISIYCSGLGLVTPSGVSGAAAASNPPQSTVANPTVSIGGMDAPVSFSGLTPGVAGLYQVNALVPAGVTTGNAVPLILTIAGVASNTVTVAISQ